MKYATGSTIHLARAAADRHDSGCAGPIAVRREGFPVQAEKTHDYPGVHCVRKVFADGRATQDAFAAHCESAQRRPAIRKSSDRRTIAASQSEDQEEKAHWRLLRLPQASDSGLQARKQ